MQISIIMLNLEDVRMFPAINKDIQVVDERSLFSESKALENLIECRDMTSSLKYLILLRQIGISIILFSLEIFI